MKYISAAIMPVDDTCIISSNQLSSGIQITVRIKQCPKSRKSIISKVPHDYQMFKIHDDFFTFDHIKWGNDSQEQVYKVAAYPFVEQALRGHDATILAYGPSGTGKSYTMGSLLSMISNWQNSGLIQRCLKHIFEEDKIQVSASFVELYDGEIHDLFNMGAIVDRGVAFNPKIKGIRSLEAGLQLVNKSLEIRQERRNSSSSLQNIFTSQSHALLTLHLKVEYGKKFLESKLNLVDLAGSRIVSGHYVFGGESHLDESLSALDRVITGMSRKFDPMLSYKDSILASILKDLLDTKCLVSLIACISSDPANDCRATFRTLRVAESVKNVQMQQHIRLTSASLTNQPKRTEKLQVVLSPKVQNIEVSDNQDQKPVIMPSMEEKIKNCAVILKKSDLDFYENKKGLERKKHIAPVNHSEVEIQNGKIPLNTVEAANSERTDSTLSISNIQTQNTEHETFIDTDLSTTQYNKYIMYDDSFSMGSLQDMAAVKPAEFHTIKEDVLDSECQCSFHGFASLNELVSIAESSTYQSVAEKQSILADSVSQLSISEQKTINPECQNKKQGSSKSKSVPSDDQSLEKLEVSRPVTRINRMKRMKAILTTDFSKPGPSQVDYQTPRKMIKLDKKNPVLILKRIPDSWAEPEEECPKENHYNNIKNQEKELNEKQKAHNNNILRILNTSTAEQLIDLPRIGFKTAVSIYQYRLIYGEFKSLRVLEDMPIWTKKVCHRFFAANNVIFSAFE